MDGDSSWNWGSLEIGFLQTCGLSLSGLLPFSRAEATDHIRGMLIFRIVHRVASEYEH